MPDPPVNVKLLMSCQSRYARISWQFFNENNAQVQNFIIQYNTSFDPNIWVTAKESEHKTKYYETIELSPWGNYSFRVIARNEVGEGMPSVPTQGECQVPPDVPEHNPDNVCTANDTPHTLTITWQVGIIVHEQSSLDHFPPYSATLTLMPWFFVNNSSNFTI